MEHDGVSACISFSKHYQREEKMWVMALKSLTKGHFSKSCSGGNKNMLCLNEDVRNSTREKSSVVDFPRISLHHENKSIFDSSFSFSSPFLFSVKNKNKGRNSRKKRKGSIIY